MNETEINLMALSGKLAVESGSWNRLQKESLKLGIDILADIMKNAQTTKESNFSVMGLSVYQIRFVKEVAEEYGLERVEIFPCPVNSEVIACFKMEGGDIMGFQKVLGIPPLQNESVTISESDLSALIEQYGVVLYQRGIDR